RLSQRPLMEFMIRHDGRELGPYSEAEVRSRLIAGLVALADPARAEGRTEWLPLSTFAQFSVADRELPSPPATPIPPVATQSAQRAPALAAQKLGAYTAATLQPDERPLHQTAIHWMALTGSITGAFLALIVIVP